MTIQQALDDMKPNSWFANFMQTESSLEACKDWTPKAEWSDIREFVSKNDYDRLLAAFKLCVQQRDEWAVPGSGSDIEDLLNKDNAALIEKLEGR